MVCLCPRRGGLDYDQMNYHFDDTILSPLLPFRKIVKVVVNLQSWRFKSVSVCLSEFLKKILF